MRGGVGGSPKQVQKCMGGHPDGCKNVGGGGGGGSPKQVRKRRGVTETGAKM